MTLVLKDTWCHIIVTCVALFVYFLEGNVCKVIIFESLIRMHGTLLINNIYYKISKLLYIFVYIICSKLYLNKVKKDIFLAIVFEFYHFNNITWVWWNRVYYGSISEERSSTYFTLGTCMEYSWSYIIYVVYFLVKYTLIIVNFMHYYMGSFNSFNLFTTDNVIVVESDSWCYNLWLTPYFVCHAIL